MIKPGVFERLLLTWFDQHGRKHLPWQHQKTPYRVWISEIMLQQTQVATVIPYYERFIKRFPNVETLALAAEDEVLHFWAGLGYYSRARNLLKAAQYVTQRLHGQFPDNSKAWQALPGVGQSTAGAILAIAFNQVQPILDGNVKRVLSRFFGIKDPIDEKRTEATLWKLATHFTSQKRPADYTQAIMDLGASLCARGNPQCIRCPLRKHCLAYQHDLTEQIPIKKKKRTLPVQNATFLIFMSRNYLFLQKRPDKGIWGGLWSFPEIAGLPDEQKIKQLCGTYFQHSLINHPRYLPAFRHTFSHYHLIIHPVLIEMKKEQVKLIASEAEIWYNPYQPDPIGLPKPAQIIIRSLADASSQLRQIKKRSRRAA